MLEDRWPSLASCVGDWACNYIFREKSKVWNRRVRRIEARNRAHQRLLRKGQYARPPGERNRDSPDPTLPPQTPKRHRRGRRYEEVESEVDDDETVRGEPNWESDMAGQARTSGFPRDIQQESPTPRIHRDFAGPIDPGPRRGPKRNTRDINPDNGPQQHISSAIQEDRPSQGMWEATASEDRTSPQLTNDEEHHQREAHQWMSCHADPVPEDVHEPDTAPKRTNCFEIRPPPRTAPAAPIQATFSMSTPAGSFWEYPPPYKSFGQSSLVFGAVPGLENTTTFRERTPFADSTPGASPDIQSSPSDHVTSRPGFKKPLNEAVRSSVTLSHLQC